MAKKAQESAKCIYCKNLGVTKEHIISDWISKDFDDGKKEYYIKPWKQDPANPKQYMFAPLKVKQGRIGQITLRRVCETCNSGWMKTIVDESIHIVKALIHQEKFTLTADDKRKIGAWAVLSCIHLDYYLSYKNPVNLRAISQVDLDFIFNNHFPSDKFEVWISRSEDPEFSKNLFGQATCLRLAGSTDQIFNSFDFTMSIRQVIFFVRYNNTQYPSPADLDMIMHKFTLVWPNSENDVAYPNDKVLNKEETNIFFARMNAERAQLRQYSDAASNLRSIIDKMGF